MKFFLLMGACVVGSTLVVFFFSSNKYDDGLRHSHTRRLGLDPHTTVLKVPPLAARLVRPPECPRRDLSAHTTERVGQQYLDAVPNTLEGSNCLSFDCNQDVNECDNGDVTNYDGPKPPCCTHVLRDMTRIFDEEMCSLGLDYFAAFGSLLGLRRSDKFMPWSASGDLIIHSAEAMNALVMLWDSQKTGMSHHYSSGMNRMCVTPDFGGGRLYKWAYLEERHRRAIDEWEDRNWDSGYPHLDIYIGRSVVGGKILELGARGHRCLHYYQDVFPTERKFVYNGQFAMNFPPNPDQLLRTNYAKMGCSLMDD